MTPDFPFPVPIVSAIVERQRQGVTEVLVQVRWKPDRDPIYSGTFEIPAGGIELGESIYEALRREVFEETGLRVTGFRPEVRTATHSQNGDDVFAFVPFCCQQQLSGGARVGLSSCARSKRANHCRLHRRSNRSCGCRRRNLKQLLAGSAGAKYSPSNFRCCSSI
jgi:ADP-ribose pyrophosphatase YjhB (NUDIX family)